MSNLQDARDPYLGLVNHIREQFRKEIRKHYVIGKVLSADPILVHADGMNLDQEDLFVAQHLIPFWTEELNSLSWPLTAQVPTATFEGTCVCSFGSGTCQVSRPQETIRGETTDKASVSHHPYLRPGDLVLLIPSEDGQIYYLIEKMVKPGEVIL